MVAKLNKSIKVYKDAADIANNKLNLKDQKLKSIAIKLSNLETEKVFANNTTITAQNEVRSLRLKLNNTVKQNDADSISFSNLNTHFKNTKIELKQS